VKRTVTVAKLTLYLIFSSIAVSAAEPQRVGAVVELNEEMEQQYRDLHANAWPEVLAAISESNIQNYSIFLHRVNGKLLLFSYYEYVGDDFETDMKILSSNPKVLEWLELTNPCQKPIPEAEENEWWTEMEQVFFHSR